MLRRKLADALANSGWSAEAACEFRALATAYTDQRSHELKRLAALHFFISGRTSDGMQVLNDVVKAVGLRIPKSMKGAFFSLIYHRVKLKIRGHRFRPVEPNQVDEGLRSRIRVCRSAGHGLFLLDPLRAIDFLTQHLYYALESGDLAEIAVAFAWEAVGVAMGGWDMESKSLQLLKKAEQIAQTLNDPIVAANVAAARGFSSGVMGNCKGVLEDIDHSIELFRSQCVGAFYEQTLAEGTALWTANFGGNIAALRSRIPAYFAEGNKRDDIHRMSHVANMVLLPLADDQPNRAETEVRQRLAAISKYSIGFSSLFGLLRPDADSLVSWRRSSSSRL